VGSVKNSCWVALLLAGCASSGATVVHDDPQLASHEGERVILKTDLDAAVASQALDRLERLEKLLDTKESWLAAPRDPVKALVIADEVRFRHIAHSHGVQDPGLGAFACSAGEVVIRYRPEEWGQGPVEGWFVAPRLGPVALAVFRRRLEQAYGANLERTRVEDGCGRAFVEKAARELGEGPEAARRARDDLLDAFLPIFLGGDHMLARTALATGSSAVDHGVRRGSGRAQGPGISYAVARFLVESDGGKRIWILQAILRHAAGGPEDDDWARAHVQLDQDEGVFERWLRDATVSELLDALEKEPVSAARWEARAAVRLLTKIDIDENAAPSPDEYARAVARARIDAKKLPQVRFTEEWDGTLLSARRAHASMEKVLGEVRKELDRRSRGYGNPALEDGRARLGQALQERLRELSQGREPG